MVFKFCHTILYSLFIANTNMSANKHVATIATSPENPFRAISFTPSSEWVIICSGLSVTSSWWTIVCHQLYFLDKPASQLSPLILHWYILVSYTVFPFFSLPVFCLTVPLLSIIISYQASFQLEEKQSRLPWQQCHIFMNLRGRERMCVDLLLLLC